MVQRFPSTGLFTPGEVRLPVSITGDGALATEGPAELAGWVQSYVDASKVTEFVGVRRNDGLDVPYWEIRTTLPDAKIYTLRLEGDDGYGANVEIMDPIHVFSPLTGAPLPPFDTPTADDHRGVEPYCSRTPDPCPFHQVTLTDALASGKPVLYMVGTPAHCQTGTCAPGLEFLIEQYQRVGDQIVVVHADVYADDAGTLIAPAVEALGVEYEPIIYFTDAAGVVVDRLDGVWDRSELAARLDLLLS
ncbi:MAG: hypothetical protein R2694_12180 [Ilumatobacteraceae bacterium]